MNSHGNRGPFELRMVKLSPTQFRFELSNVSGDEARNIRFQVFLLEKSEKARHLDLNFDDVDVLEPGARSILQPTEQSLSISNIDELLVRLTREGADRKSYELRIFFDHPKHAHQIISLGAGSDVPFPRKS